MRFAPNWTESMTASARGDRPRRLLICPASMAPVTTMGVSETTGETPILRCRPSPVAVAKPRFLSVMWCLTSRSITSSPPSLRPRSWGPR